MTAKRDEAGNMVTTENAADTTQSNWIVRKWQDLVRFLREVRIELKKTNWPTRNELTKAVAVVLMTIIVVAAVLFIYDQISTRLAKWLFDIKDLT